MPRLLALVLAALLLAGCASRGKPEQPASASVPQAAPVEQTAAAPSDFREGQETAPPPQSTAPIDTPEPPQDDEFVPVSAWLPEVRQELRYAGEDNFTGQRIYPFWEAYLRYGTVKKLTQVSRELEEQGLRLKLWDAYRPVSAQWKLWEAVPDPTYVADPRKGFSSHSRGNTVDITLTDAQGNDLLMPTDFDDFSPLADRNYSDCTPEQAANARLLEQTMERWGFTGYRGEWWHFTDCEEYPVEQTFEPPLG